MLQKINDFFQGQAGFSRVEALEVRHIKALYFSTQQIFAVTEYQSDTDLAQHWERAAHQLAHKVQNYLPLELDDLRWDMYLVIYVNQDTISNELRRMVEWNNFYFKKIIVTRSEINSLKEKLPLPFDMDFSRTNSRAETTMLFSDEQFLQQLKKCMNVKSRQLFGDSFFEKTITDHSEIISVFSKVEDREGQRSEN